MNSNQQVIIELKSGTKCEGILVSIDKEKMLIKLSSAKRISLGEDGKTIEETFPQLEIAKEEIKEVKIVQFEPSANQDAKISESAQSANLNAIPQNLQNNALNNQNLGRTYDKTDSFFDALTPMTNKDAQYESIRYNDKNCETFDLPKGGNYDNGSSYGNRRGGRGRGGNRGGYRGGYNNNYRNNNYNNNYKNNNYQNPNNNFYNNEMGNPNNNTDNNNGGNFRGQNQNFRGGYRGGYINCFQRRDNYPNNDYNNRNFKNNNNNFPNNDNFSNYSNQFQKQAQMFGTNNNPSYQMSSGMQQPNFDSNSGNFGNFHRGRGGQSRGFGGNNYRGRGGNRNYNSNANIIPNPEFNSINENNDVHDQLDDDYSMSIYDKPSSSQAFASQKLNTENLSVYDPNAGKN